MENGRSPGNDGLTCTFDVTLWESISDPLFESFCDAKNKGILSTSQRQAVIKLIKKKKTRDSLKIGDPFLC